MPFTSYFTKLSRIYISVKLGSLRTPPHAGSRGGSSFSPNLGAMWLASVIIQRRAFILRRRFDASPRAGDAAN